MYRLLLALLFTAVVVSAVPPHETAYSSPRRHGAAPPGSPLVGYYAMEQDPFTQVSDSSTYGNALTFVNGSATNAGKINIGRQFLGSGPDYYLASSSSSFNMTNTDFTVWAWAKYVNTNSTMHICGRRSSPHTFSGQYTMGGRAAGWFFELFDNGTTSYILDAGVLITTNVWTFVMIDWDNTSKVQRIMVNNASTNSATRASAVVPNIAASFVVGAQSTVGGFLNGYVDEVGIIKRKLTAAEMTALYNGGTGVTWPLPITP